MSLVLGVDGGATKTSTVVMDVESRFISEYESGSCNYKSIGIKKQKKI